MSILGLRPCDFEPVRTSVLKQLAQNAWESELGYLFLTPFNLHYIFCEYVARVQAETGFVLDPLTFAPDIYSRLIYEMYIDGVCRYENFNGDKSRLEQALLVERWNQDTIGALVFEALKLQRKKVNWLRRVRDPFYGMKEFCSIQLAKPFVSRYENSMRWAYSQIGVNKQSHPVLDDGVG